MRYLSLPEVLYLHRRILEMSGGHPGLRDLSGLESAPAQPKQSFGGSDLYPSLMDKAVALCFSIVRNHPFVDGNKRIAHAAVVMGHNTAVCKDERTHSIRSLDHDG
jgi:death-on-curing protein